MPDNERLVEAFENGRTGLWVSGHGTVSQVLSDEMLGFPRQRIMVQVTDSLRVMVQHSMLDSVRVPVERGDVIAFQGRYEFNGNGGNVTLTHSDPEQPGGGGWIRHAGITYD
ncbi:MAG: DUF3465 domain-containing protein [Wenzhouxiangella sp.]